MCYDADRVASDTAWRVTGFRAVLLYSKITVYVFFEWLEAKQEMLASAPRRLLTQSRSTRVFWHLWLCEYPSMCGAVAVRTRMLRGGNAYLFVSAF